MGKKKASVIAIAVLTCIVCLSMIAGATFALFTDNDKVNVSVTTANLSVKAEIADVAKDTNGTSENKQLVYDYNQADKLLTIENMLPGDVVTFKVTITSGASVDVKYRVKFGCTTKDSSLFEQMLLGVKDTAEGNYQYYVSSTSAWGQIDYNATDASKMVVTKYVAIELPAYVSAKALEAQTCNIEFAVEAVQANATGDYFTANETSVKAVRVKDTALTDNVIGDDVIAQLQDEGDCLVLDGTSVHNWTIDTTLAKTFSVRGCDVDTLTVNAPNATINYYVNNTKIIDINKTANNSFHVYGVVAGSLTVKEGRAVVEQGAQVASAVIAPAAEAEATIVTNASVANLSVEGAGKANVEVAKDVVIESVEVTNTGKTDITNNGSFGSITADENADITSTGSSNGVITVTDEKSLAAAIKIGGEVVLVNDIVLEHTIRISNSVTLKLSGHAITFIPTEDLVTRPLVINEGAALTVYGEESGSQILVTVDTVYGVFDIYGELAVYGGHYEASDGTGGSVVRGRVGSKTHIYSGEFVSKGYGAALYDEGDCIIEDGYFFTNSNNRKNNAWSYCFQNAGGTMHVKNATVIGIQGGIAAVGGETIIDDCTVNVRDPFKTSEKDNKSFYALYVNGNHAEATCRVNGGEFTSEYRYAVFIGNPTPGDGGEQRYSMAEIYGGTFISGTEGPECVLVSDPNGNGYIPGGTYISHVKTAAQLKQALAANLPNYTIVLDEDIELATAISFTDSQSLTLDLNGHVLTVDGKKLVSTGTGAPIAAKGNSSLTIINGTIAPKNYRTTQSTIDMYDTASVVIDHVNISRLAGGYRSYGYGVSAFGNGTITINDSTIEAGCAVSTNASEDINPTITINRSKIIGYSTGLLFNVNGTLNVTDTEIVGINQGVFMRAGTATFTDSTIKTTLQDLGTTNMLTISKEAATGTFNPYYTDPNGKNTYGEHWGSGTQNIPLAALVIGCSKAESSYWKHASVTLVNTTVDESEEFLAIKGEDVGMIHHAILAWNAHGEEGSATFTMDDASKALLNGTVCTVVGMDYSKAVVE